MKNKLYYTLFLFYAITAAIILHINGVFNGTVTSLSNLLINGGFLVIIGILFLISTISFGKLNRCTDELVAVMEQMQKEYQEEKARNLWSRYEDKKDLFQDENLRSAFNKYRTRMRSYRTKRGYMNTCDLEEFINEDLIDKVGMSFFNSGMSGTLTGLGILGTFLGLSMGLGSFNGDDIYTISDNVGPLLTGMKVAFHTSVYGIFFSLIFNYVYRSIMADAYEKLDAFLATFRLCAMPIVSSGDENSSAMLVYQANMANSLKQMLEMMKGNTMEQTAAVGRIVNQFTEQMNDSLGGNFQKLGNVMKSAGQAQSVYVERSRDLMEAVTAMVETERKNQEILRQMMEKQEDFSKELLKQKEVLADACEDISNEVSNQLYTFDQMRNLYEK